MNPSTKNPLNVPGTAPTSYYVATAVPIQQTHPYATPNKIYPPPAVQPTVPPGSSISNAPAAQQTYKVIDIGTQFCRQYYKMLSMEPEVGHKFYSKHSHLIHGQEGDLEAPMCFGLEEIQQRILQMGFSGCRVFISTIDCQASLQGGVAVMVLGRMQMRGSVSRKFAQSIFLAEQPTGFFVLNDIFRFIDTDEQPSPIQLSPVVSSGIAVQSPVQPVNPMQSASPIRPPVQQSVQHSVQQQHAVQQQHPVQQQYPVSQAELVKKQDPEMVAWGDSTWAAESFSGASTTTPTATSTNAATATVTPSSAPQAIKSSSRPSILKKEQKIEEKQPDPGRSSWAELAQDRHSRWGDGVVSEAKGTSVASPVPSAPRTLKSTSSLQASTFYRRDRPSSSTSDDQTANNLRRDRRHINENYVAEASVFVGGLKQRMEEVVVREAFGGFGEIKGIEIARECVFVEFMTVDAAQKALTAGTASLGGSDARIEKRRPPRPSYNQTGPRTQRFHSSSSLGNRRFGSSDGNKN